MEKRGKIFYKLWTVMGDKILEVEYKIKFLDEDNIHIEMGFPLQEELSDEVLDEVLQECLEDSEKPQLKFVIDGYDFSIN